MNQNQINLINVIVNNIIPQLNEKDLIKLNRTFCIDNIKNNNIQLFNSIYGSLNDPQNIQLMRDISTPILNHPRDIIEFILEIIWSKITNYNLDILDRYYFWENYKIQNNYLLLK